MVLVYIRATRRPTPIGVRTACVSTSSSSLRSFQHWQPLYLYMWRESSCWLFFHSVQFTLLRHYPLSKNHVFAPFSTGLLFSGGTVFFAHNESASAKFQRAEQGRNQAGVSQQLQRQIKQTFHRQEFNILTNATDIMNSFLVPAATCLMRSSCGYRHSIAQMLADKQQHKAPNTWHQRKQQRYLAYGQGEQKLGNEFIAL